MEVQHNENMDSHAVIGGAKVRAFGISDNAEFITMLSEGLYSDKMMAVIREVLCNAHDAHVNNKCLHIPIKITLNTDKLIISDSGKGIHDDAINSIYCVYGNSTKTHSGEENGGFGLGSKAPFAYTTHFTVISKHGGRKIIYAVSRGSSETQGKPDMREIANVPTTETGLEVSLPIAAPADVVHFENLIRAVTYFGEMNVEFNGQILNTLPFSTLTQGFMIVNKNSQEFMTNSLYNHKLYVRYGTVIYPIEPHADYIHDYNSLYSIVSGGSRIMVLQAKPNTIAVTPSRESLSMTNRTRETLTGLMKEVAKIFTETALPAYREVVNDFMVGHKALSITRLRAFLTEYNFNPHASFIQDFQNKPITTAHDVAKLLMINTNAHIKSDSPFRIEKHTRYNVRMELFTKHDPECASFYRTMSNLAPESHDHNQTPKFKSVWNKMHFSNIKGLIPKELFGYLRLRYPTHSTSGKVVTMLEVTDTHYEDNFCDLKHIVVAHNLRDMNAALEEQSLEDEQLYAFLIPRKKGLDEQIYKLIEDMKMVCVDGCLAAVKQPVDPNKVKRPKGYAALRSLVDTLGNYVPDRLSHFSVDRIERPMNVVYERTRDREKVIYGLEFINLNYYLELVPNTVIVSNPNTFEALRKKGSFNGVDSLVYAVKNVFLTDPEFVRSLYNEQRNRTGVAFSLQKFIEYDGKIASMFRGQPLSQNSKLLAALHFFKKMKSHHWVGDKSYYLVQDVNKAVSEFSETDYLVNSLNDNPLLAALDLNIIYNSLVSNSPDAPKQMLLLHLALQ